MGYLYPIRGHSCDSACEEPHLAEHRDDCECCLCHEGHEDNGMWLTDGGLTCCTDHVNLLVERGEWCGKHRRPFIDLSNTICSVCEWVAFFRRCWDKKILTGAGAMALILEVEGDRNA